MKNINQAIYSRNWAENRRFNMWEIQQKLDLINDPKTGVLPKHRNTFLPKIASDLKKRGITPPPPFGKFVSRYSRYK